MLSVLNVVLHLPLRVRNLVVVHRVEIVTLRSSLKYQSFEESSIHSAHTHYVGVQREVGLGIRWNAELPVRSGVAVDIQVGDDFIAATSGAGETAVLPTEVIRLSLAVTESPVREVNIHVSPVVQLQHRGVPGTQGTS